VENEGRNAHIGGPQWTQQSEEDPMSKHLADKPRVADTGRLRRYTEIERDGGAAREQTLELQRRKRDGRDDGKRASEFARIERGHTA
jgi:hypothetical protein